jgi:sulfur carrier protein ThiS
MNVVLRNPRREVEIAGPLPVHALLERLQIHRDTVLVIVDGTLMPGDSMLPADARVEIRPVISGGA